MSSSSVNGTRAANLRHMFRALKGRNYSLFFFGQGVSLIGTWMQTTALSWLVYRKTNDPFMLGLVAFASTIFSFLVSPIAGVFTDRWNRHRVLILMQVLSMVQASVLAALTLTGVIQVWQILGLAMMLGLINSIDVPNRQSFIIQMVDRREDLPNAIALNSFAFNGARLIGPTIAGFIIWAAGEGVCFLANATSYIAVLAALLAMRISPPPETPRKHLLHELREGFGYAFGFPPIRAILLLLGIMGLLATQYATLIPIFAKDILHGDARLQGQLIAAIGVGALIGAIFLASRRSVRGLGRIIGTAPILLGLGLIVLGLSRWPHLSMAVLAVVGFGQMVQMAGSNTLLQTIVDDDKRGRVMSFYTIAFMGTGPFGSLLAGYLASHIGAQWAVILSGMACVVSAAMYLQRLPHLRQFVRPIYVKMGIISDTPPIPEEAAQEDINGVER